MSKKKKSLESMETQVLDTTVSPAIIEETPATEVTATEPAKKLGRPVVPGSARQTKLAGIEERKAKGEEIKKGRPVKADSARQMKLAAKQAAIEAGTPIKLGRPKGSGVKVVEAELPAEVEPVTAEVTATVEV